MCSLPAAGLWCGLVLSLCGCGVDDDVSLDSALPYDYITRFDFNEGKQGWSAGFANYPLGISEREAFFGFAHAPLPFRPGMNALRLSAHPFWGNTFMFVKREIRGLEPNTNYFVYFETALAYGFADSLLADNKKKGSLFIKASALTQEPVVSSSTNLLNPSLNDRGSQADSVRLGIDLGAFSQEGRDAMLVGRISVGSDDQKENTPLFGNTLGRPFGVTSGRDGSVWIVFGAETDVQEKHILYISGLTVYYAKAP